MGDKFVPDSFIIPTRVETNDFVVKKLTVGDVDKDYKAVMSSKESLRQIFCVDDDWPGNDFTIDENYNDLLEHEREFDNRIGFAYTILNKDETETIGCIYIYPWFREKYDTRVYFWVVDKVKTNLEDNVHNFITNWIDKDWPLESPVFPGRDMTFLEWDKFVRDSR